MTPLIFLGNQRGFPVSLHFYEWAVFPGPEQEINGQNQWRKRGRKEPEGHLKYLMIPFQSKYLHKLTRTDKNTVLYIGASRPGGRFSMQGVRSTLLQAAAYPAPSPAAQQ